MRASSAIEQPRFIGASEISRTVHRPEALERHRSRNLTSPNEQKVKHRRLSDFHAPDINSRSALDQSIILLGATMPKLEGLINSQDEDFTRFDGNSREAIRGSVGRSHAVNPCIHVAPVEVWKSKFALKGIVKARPVDDLLNGDGNRSHHVQYNTTAGSPRALPRLLSA